MTFDELLSRVMGLSREIREYWETEGRKRLRSYPLVYPDEEPIPPPPQQAELEKLLASQPEERLIAVAALRWIGFPGGKAENFADAYEEQRARLTALPNPAIAVASGAGLGLYIEDGLVKLADAGLSPTVLLPTVALAG